MQARDVTNEIVKAVAGDAARSVQVYAAEALHDLRVIGDVKLRGLGLAEALNFHIMAVIRADRYAGVYHLRDAEHGGAQLFLQLCLLGFQRGQALCVGLDLGLHRLGFFELGRVLLRLAHEHADLLGQRVSRGPQLICLGYSSPEPGIAVYRLIHQRQLRVLEFFAYVLAHRFRVLAHKFDVKHVSFPSFLFI